MKKGKLFAKILYFFVTFVFGILIAVFLPFIFMYYGESVEIIQKSLNEGKYDQAMRLVGGYYDKVPVFQQDFEDGGGIVLFTAASLVPGVSDENKEIVEDAKLHLAYSGFLYNTKSYYQITGQDSNQAKLIVVDTNEQEHNVDLLDTDTNDDGVKDCVATYKTKSFIYLDLDKDTYGSLKQLKFYDKEGVLKITVDLSLEYSEVFFTDVNDFVVEYNNDFKSEKLPDLDKEFRAKSDNYLISSDGVAKSSADKKAAIIVVVYFVIVYVIADFILGSHLIIRFFKWLLVKVFKVKFKTKAPKTEVFGHDYYCKFTLSADLGDIQDFDESIQVRYSNEHEEVTFILLKSRNYTATESVKAGNYVNLWVDINENYLTQNLPDILEVEGYHKQLTFKILKRED